MIRVQALAHLREAYNESAHNSANLPVVRLHAAALQVHDALGEFDEELHGEARAMSAAGASFTS